MPVPYDERNEFSKAISMRLPIDLAAAVDAMVILTGVSKTQIFLRLFTAYVEGRIGTPNVDLPLPPQKLKDVLMAAAKKKVAVKAKAAPAAKAKTAAKKK